jgi:hypothetical protein
MIGNPFVFCEKLLGYFCAEGCSILFDGVGEPDNGLACSAIGCRWTAETHCHQPSLLAVSARLEPVGIGSSRLGVLCISRKAA